MQDDYHMGEKDVIIALIRQLEALQYISDELTAVEQALAANMEKLPVVKFLEGQIRVINPQEFKKEFKGCGEAKRWQIPLSLAWAISIHKSQGMTIDLLRVNLDGCFASGQAYVACSRGRSAETMVLESFAEQRIITSDLVKQFYSSLKDGTAFDPPTWTMLLEDAKKEGDVKERMEQQYGGKTCHKCQSVCTVYAVKKDGRNKGKWVRQCQRALDSLRNGGPPLPGHTWNLLPAPGLI